MSAKLRREDNSLALAVTEILLQDPKTLGEVGHWQIKIYEGTFSQHSCGLRLLNPCKIRHLHQYL